MPIHQRLQDGSLVPNGIEWPAEPEIRCGGHAAFSTAGDYCRFMRALLRGGELDGERVLTEATVTEAFSDHLGGIALPEVIKSANPLLSNDIVSPPVPQGWGLGFHLMLADLPGMRASGTGDWAGLANCYYWIDRSSGVCGAILTQVLPFFDERIVGTALQFEAAVYAQVAAGKRGDPPTLLPLTIAPGSRRANLVSEVSLSPNFPAKVRDGRRALRASARRDGGRRSGRGASPWRAPCSAPLRPAGACWSGPCACCSDMSSGGTARSDCGWCGRASRSVIRPGGRHAGRCCGGPSTSTSTSTSTSNRTPPRGRLPRSPSPVSPSPWTGSRWSTAPGTTREPRRCARRSPHRTRPSCRRSAADRC